MTDARCEPRPNGWYWQTDVVTGHPRLCRWITADARLVLAQFACNGLALNYGDNELSPVLTPAEVAALRAERDAAVAENHKLKTGNKLLADTVRSWGWESRKQESNGELVGRALWEQYGALAALCAEVEKLRAALKPFADAAPKFRDCGDVIEVADIAHDATFTVGDLRRAATLANAVEVPE